MNKLLLLPLVLLLQSCSLFKSEPEPLPLPPVKVITETVQLEIYQPPLPPEIQLDDIKWFVLTEANLEEKIKEVKSFTGADFVLFGLTPQSYENMAYNFQEMRRYIRQQTEIIKYYREATKPKGPEGWLQENERNQNIQLEIEESNNQPEILPSEDKESKTEGFLKGLIPKF
jgi:hypothetical protein